MVGSLPEYEDLVAEIYWGDDFVGFISQEQGPEAMVLELSAGREPGKKFSLADFVDALAKAGGRLLELQRKA